MAVDGSGQTVRCWCYALVMLGNVRYGKAHRATFTTHQMSAYTHTNAKKECLHYTTRPPSVRLCVCVQCADDGVHFIYM